MPQITVYGWTTCEDTQRSRVFLDSRQVPYTWVDLDGNDEAVRIVQGHNNGNISTPTIVFDDGAVLVEPSDGELAQKLGSTP